MELPRVFGQITCPCGVTVKKKTRNQIRCESCAKQLKAQKARIAADNYRKKKHAL